MQARHCQSKCGVVQRGIVRHDKAMQGWLGRTLFVALGHSVVRRGLQIRSVHDRARLARLSSAQRGAVRQSTAEHG